MQNYTPYQSRYFAEQISLKRPQSSFDSIASAMSGVKVDLNPHQVNAAMFAVKSPLAIHYTNSTVTQNVALRLFLRMMHQLENGCVHLPNSSTFIMVLVV